MKINSELKQIRKKYLAVEPPPDLVKYGWLALRKEIETQERLKLTLWPILTRHVIFAVIIMVFLGGGLIGLVKASQNSLPGDRLYPFKRLSESVITALSGDKQVKLEKRAEEVVGVAQKKNDQVLLKEAVKNYQDTVSKTKQEVTKSDKKEEFQKKLQKEEQQFEDTSKKMPPASKDVLNTAIEASKKGREGEVKGVEHKEIPSEIKQETETIKKNEQIEPTKKQIEGIIK